MASLVNKPQIGRRTGIDITKGRNIRKLEDGFEDFNDYWSDSDITQGSLDGQNTNQEDGGSESLDEDSDSQAGSFIILSDTSQSGNNGTSDDDDIKIVSDENLLTSKGTPSHFVNNTSKNRSDHLPDLRDRTTLTHGKDAHQNATNTLENNQRPELSDKNNQTADNQTKTMSDENVLACKKTAQDFLKNTSKNCDQLSVQTNQTVSTCKKDTQQNATNSLENNKMTKLSNNTSVCKKSVQKYLKSTLGEDESNQPDKSCEWTAEHDKQNSSESNQKDHLCDKLYKNSTACSQVITESDDNSATCTVTSSEESSQLDVNICSEKDVSSHLPTTIERHHNKTEKEKNEYKSSTKTMNIQNNISVCSKLNNGNQISNTLMCDLEMKEVSHKEQNEINRFKTPVELEIDKNENYDESDSVFINNNSGESKSHSKSNQNEESGIHSDSKTTGNERETLSVETGGQNETNDCPALNANPINLEMSETNNQTDVVTSEIHADKCNEIADKKKRSDSVLNGNTELPEKKKHSQKRQRLNKDLRKVIRDIVLQYGSPRQSERLVILQSQESPNIKTDQNDDGSTKFAEKMGCTTKPVTRQNDSLPTKSKSKAGNVEPVKVTSTKDTAQESMQLRRSAVIVGAGEDNGTITKIIEPSSSKESSDLDNLHIKKKLLFEHNEAEKAMLKDSKLLKSSVFLDKSSTHASPSKTISSMEIVETTSKNSALSNLPFSFYVDEDDTLLHSKNSSQISSNQNLGSQRSESSKDSKSHLKKLTITSKVNQNKPNATETAKIRTKLRLKNNNLGKSSDTINQPASQHNKVENKINCKQKIEKNLSTSRILRTKNTKNSNLKEKNENEHNGNLDISKSSEAISILFSKKKSMSLKNKTAQTNIPSVNAAKKTSDNKDNKTVAIIELENDVQNKYAGLRSHHTNEENIANIKYNKSQITSNNEIVETTARVRTLKKQNKTNNTNEVDETSSRRINIRSRTKLSEETNKPKIVLNEESLNKINKGNEKQKEIHALNQNAILTENLKGNKFKTKVKAFSDNIEINTVESIDFEIRPKRNVGLQSKQIFEEEKQRNNSLDEMTQKTIVLNSINNEHMATRANEHKVSVTDEIVEKSKRTDATSVKELESKTVSIQDNTVVLDEKQNVGNQTEKDKKTFRQKSSNKQNNADADAGQQNINPFDNTKKKRKSIMKLVIENFSPSKNNAKESITPIEATRRLERKSSKSKNEFNADNEVNKDSVPEDTQSKKRFKINRQNNVNSELEMMAAKKDKMGRRLKKTNPDGIEDENPETEVKSKPIHHQNDSLSEEKRGVILTPSIISYDFKRNARKKFNSKDKFNADTEVQEGNLPEDDQTKNKDTMKIVKQNKVNSDLQMPVLNKDKNGRKLKRRISEVQDENNIARKQLNTLPVENSENKSISETTNHQKDNSSEERQNVILNKDKLNLRKAKSNIEQANKLDSDKHQKNNVEKRTKKRGISNKKRPVTGDMQPSQKIRRSKRNIDEPEKSNLNNDKQDIFKENDVQDTSLIVRKQFNPLILAPIVEENNSFIDSRYEEKKNSYAIDKLHKSLYTEFTAPNDISSEFKNVSPFENLCNENHSDTGIINMQEKIIIGKTQKNVDVDGAITDTRKSKRYPPKTISNKKFEISPTNNVEVKRPKGIKYELREKKDEQKKIATIESKQQKRNCHLKETNQQSTPLNNKSFNSESKDKTSKTKSKNLKESDSILISESKCLTIDVNDNVQSKLTTMLPNVSSKNIQLSKIKNKLIVAEEENKPSELKKQIVQDNEYAKSRINNENVNIFNDELLQNSDGFKIDSIGDNNKKVFNNEVGCDRVYDDDSDSNEITFKNFSGRLCELENFSEKNVQQLVFNNLSTPLSKTINDNEEQNRNITNPVESDSEMTVDGDDSGDDTESASVHNEVFDTDIPNVFIASTHQKVKQTETNETSEKNIGTQTSPPTQKSHVEQSKLTHNRTSVKDQYLEKVVEPCFSASTIYSSSAKKRKLSDFENKNPAFSPTLSLKKLLPISPVKILPGEPLDENNVLKISTEKKSKKKSSKQLDSDSVPPGQEKKKKTKKKSSKQLDSDYVPSGQNKEKKPKKKSSKQLDSDYVQPAQEKKKSSKTKKKIMYDEEEDSPTLKKSKIDEEYEENVDFPITERMEIITKDKIIIPEQVEESLVRRSQRARVPPCQYWKNERVVYNHDNSDNMNVVGVVQTVYPTRRKTTNKKQESEPPLPPTDVWVSNPDRDEEVLMHCIQPGKLCKFRSLNGEKLDLNSTMAISKCLRQKHFGSGVMVLRNSCEKGMQYIQHSSLVFYILKGQVKVTIHETTCELQHGDSFFVPKGNTYNLVNMSNTMEAELYYVLVTTELSLE